MCAVSSAGGGTVCDNMMLTFRFHFISTKSYDHFSLYESANGMLARWMRSLERNAHKRLRL